LTNGDWGVRLKIKLILFIVNQAKAPLIEVRGREDRYFNIQSKVLQHTQSLDEKLLYFRQNVFVLHGLLKIL